MTASTDQLVAALRSALKDAETLRQENHRLTTEAAEPIAIVAMACRYAGGADTPEKLWDLVAGEVDAIRGFPADRGWDLDGLYHPDPAVTGTCYVREGGFLDAAGEFDAAFFDLAPREAAAMDPQQRLLLEVAWETVERAGVDPHSLHGTRTGVFVGAIAQDYSPSALTPPEAEGHVLTGTTTSVASGRLAYTLGLEGPAVTVDTACSSSLVALHLAMRALRAGECTLALAGGVTVMATPGLLVEFSRQRGLAPDARCKAFGAGADGTSLGEGAGLLLLERLADARRNGHPVLAVIRGSAVNSDGASNGLTAPNGPAQERVIRQALATAGLTSADVDLLEAHGTGTALGDPIEAHALLATYGQRYRATEPLWLGSVKSNIGHAQAAAGVAGVIKAVQAMRHGVMPRTLHADEPSGHVDWSAGAVSPLTRARPWPGGDRPRRAAVSSFGISGTNAHLILEEAPEPEPAPPVAPLLAGPPAFVLSAKDPAVLPDQASRLLRVLDGADPADVSHSLSAARAALRHRAVVLGGDRDALVRLAAGVPDPAIVTGTAAEPGRVAVLFTGQGSQRAGMAGELYAASPAFAAAFDQIAGHLDPHLDHPLGELLRSGSLDRTEYAQPALFAVEVALFRLLESAGVTVHYLLGHSIGELSAAYVAGVLSAADAARLVAARGALMQSMPSGGAMLAVRAGAEQVTSVLARYGDAVDLAAVNGPESVVVSGDTATIDELDRLWMAEGLRTRRLRVSHAFHSRHMDGMLADFRRVVGSVSLRPPKIPVVSNLTGRSLTAEEACSPEYWVRQVRHTVRFADGVRWLDGQGVTAYVEAGPDGVLAAAVRDCLPEGPAVVSLLRRDRPDVAAVGAALARAWVAGADLNWAALSGGRRIDLPTYPFRRRHFWLPAGTAKETAAALGLGTVRHPLLGAAVPLPESGGWLLTGRVSRLAHPWLDDHVVHGATVLPGTAWVELAAQVARRCGLGEVSELTLHEPLLLGPEDVVAIQVAVAPAEADGSHPVAIHARLAAGPDDRPWTRHASGLLGATTPPPATGWADVWPPAGAEPVDLTDRYSRLDEAGLRYGPAFRGLTAAWRRGSELFAEVELDPALHAAAPSFALHPALLDAALHVVGCGADTDDLTARPVLPFSWTGVDLAANGRVGLRVRISELGPDRIRVDAVDDAGAAVATIGSLSLRPVSAERFARPASAALYRVEWTPIEAADPPLHADEVVFREFDATDGPEHAARWALEQVQQWLVEGPESPGRLMIVTRGPGIEAAAVRGVLRSAETEHPGRFGLLDLDEGEEIPVSALVNRAELAVRGGSVLEPRLALMRAVGADRAAPFDPSGTVLVTGGTGALGRLIARHLVTRCGVRSLVLAGRRGAAAEGMDELIAELGEAGAEVRAAACDVTDRTQLTALLVGIPATAPLRAVVHAAGILDDAPVQDLTGDRLAAVLAAKAHGALLLDELTRDTELTAFVLFSSMAGTLGTAGQASYAAANAVLDALAEQRRARGLPATSLVWGPWDVEAGMVGGLSDADRRRLADLGLAPMPPDEALALFEAACATSEPICLPLLLDHRARAVPPILRGLLGDRRPPAPASGNAVGRRLRDLAGADREAYLLDLVRTQVAAVLGHAGPEGVPADQTFKELGFDSLTAVELRNGLGAATGVRLPAGLIFDHPTPRAVARVVLDALAPALAARPAAASARPVDEPVAVVGMACRYPGGVATPEDLWRLVDGGVDAVSGFPADRGWDLDDLYHPDPDHPGTSYTRHGGFLHDAASFDAAFFGISPREALAMDPQHRLLLEITWEAFEQAGINPDSMRGSDTGVFAGVMYHDYGSRPRHAPEALGGYLLAGTAGSVMSGRIAYSFGFEGPAVTVDTACSSSLVALHLAAQSLRSGECSLALAGGATVMATPDTFVEFSRQRGLAPDGRCKPYSAEADGTGWSEGAGMLVLERLSDALRHGHKVLAVIRGSAVNSDGASNGLTAPNGPAQQRVIRRALSGAGISAADVDVVEGHGTGTRLGDPIEAEALVAVYGRERKPEQPLRLGSIKSNIGHTQAAAGVAGVIKMVQALRYERLPRTLHADRPTPQVDWAGGSVRLLGEAEPWPAGPEPRRAAVSSFGISGTNAHVILEEAPAVPPAPKEPAEPAPALAWPLSARGAAALREQARRLHDFLRERPEASPADVARTLGAHRAALDERAVVVGADREQLLTGLMAVAAGREAPHVVYGTSTGPLRPVFVFPGQGSQWAGMAVRLLAESEVFAREMAACEKALAPYVEWSLLDVLREADEAPSLDRVDVVQPVLFAVMVSLAAIWRSAGVEPTAVVGHSQGEIAAAYVAGALSLADAARVVALRSSALREIAGRGGMASVGLSGEDVAARLEPFGDRLCVAAQNGPTSVVVAGDADALDELVARLTADDVRVRRITVDYASHSAHVTAIRDTLLELLEPVTPLAPAVPMYSTVTGEPIAAGDLGAAYWFENLRRSVRFAPVIEDLAGRGFDLFIEVSPHPVLLTGVREVVDAVAPETAVVATLKRDDGGARRMVEALAEAAVHGVPVDWVRLSPGERVDLPLYAFQRERFWLRPEAGRTRGEHPLLAVSVPDPEGGEWTMAGEVSARRHAWLADHTVSGVPVLPGSVVAELALHAAERLGPTWVDELVLHVPVPLTEDVEVQVRAGAGDEDGCRALRFFFRPVDGEQAWARFATGSLVGGRSPDNGTFPAGVWPPAGASPIDVADLYQRIAEAGVGYGPIFRGVRAAWRLGSDVYAEVELPGEAVTEQGDDRWCGPHPALLDAVLQVQEAAWPRTGEPARMPFSWQRLRAYATTATRLRVRMTPAGDDAVVVSVTDVDERPVLAADSYVSRPVPTGRISGAGRIYRPEWVPAEAGVEPVPDFAVLPVTAGTAPEPEAVHRTVHEVLSAIQAWLGDDRHATTTLVVTVPAGDDLAGSAVRGLVRTAQAEHPDRFVLLVTETGQATDGEVRAALATGQPQLSLQDGSLRLLRLAPVPQRPADGFPWRPEGTVLVTGIGGGLAPLVARHLVTRHGVRHLLLVSRRGPGAPGAADLVAELTGLGATATVLACDVSDPDAVRELVAAVPAERPLTGVVHAAAVLDDGVLTDLRPEQVSRVLRAKVDGALHLHAATAGLDLAAFVLFSSAAGLLGGAGQAGYAAANAALDAMARHRHARGLPALSLAWGLWEERGGMAGRLGDVDLRRDHRLGFREMTAEDALHLFDVALTAEEPVLAPMNLDLAVLRGRAGAGDLPAILRSLVPGARRSTAAGGQGRDTELLERLGGLAEEEQLRFLEDLVRRRAGEVLGMDRPLSSGKAFRDLGFDSLTALELRNRLGTSTGLRLPVTLVFDHPTPSALAARLRQELTGGDERPGPAVDEAEVRRILASVPLAGLRAAGLLDPLLRLAGAGAPAAAPEVDALADLDLDQLVEIALDGIEP
ncbi:polyketide synthase [Micromonospora tulbaghiae]|uniref:Polyketide synthase n=1 Tax=Micromonospora tulbaghiae TaxID=479978 RepID=A0A386WU25_9ACTN|nr:type I polyketide synthase [Micromonospora tulbaghiae]AYF31947.1 polyketide synthase [Micromonospora tulbaghiae]